MMCDIVCKWGMMAAKRHLALQNYNIFRVYEKVW